MDKISVPDVGEVSSILVRPDDARALLVLAHGAGADMRHRFMESAVEAFACHRIATLRYQFPYMERGTRRIDPQPTLLATVRAAVAAGAELANGLPLLAGGKSMGGRMTSLADSASRLPGVRGIIFIGFPLHPAGKPATVRGDHLDNVHAPMLFIQGTRDELAYLPLLTPVCERLGVRSTLHVIDGADHAFHVLKRSGRTDDEVIEEIARTVSEWAVMV